MRIFGVSILNILICTEQTVCSEVRTTSLVLCSCGLTYVKTIWQGRFLSRLLDSTKQGFACIFWQLANVCTFALNLRLELLKNSLGVFIWCLGKRENRNRLACAFFSSYREIRTEKRKKRHHLNEVINHRMLLSSIMHEPKYKVP